MQERTGRIKIQCELNKLHRVLTKKEKKHMNV